MGDGASKDEDAGTAARGGVRGGPPVLVLFSEAGRRGTVIGSDHLGRGAGGTVPLVLGVFCVLFWVHPAVSAWLWLWGGGGAVLGAGVAPRGAPADRDLRGALSVAMTCGIALKNCVNFWRNVGDKITIGVDSALIIHAFVLAVHGSAALVAWAVPEPPAWVPWTALGVYLVFASLEVAADEQLGAFCRAKRVPGYTGPRVMTSGLWSLSRHPNFAANTFYYAWGVGLLSGTWYVPLAWFLVFVTFYHLQAIPGHELHMAATYGDEWDAYVKRTPRYILL